MKQTPLAVLVGLLITLGISTAQAHPRHGLSHQRAVVVEREVVVVKPAPVRNLVSYRVGSVFATVPAHHLRVSHRGSSYYLADGIFYQRESRGYVVVKPLTGIRIASLPSGYVTLRVKGETRYRFNEVTYRRVGGYFVVV
jgi:hypothetical protein